MFLPGHKYMRKNTHHVVFNILFKHAADRFYWNLKKDKKKCAAFFSKPVTRNCGGGLTVSRSLTVPCCAGINQGGSLCLTVNVVLSSRPSAVFYQTCRFWQEIAFSCHSRWWTPHVGNVIFHPVFLCKWKERQKTTRNKEERTLLEDMKTEKFRYRRQYFKIEMSG